MKLSALVCGPVAACLAHWLAMTVSADVIVLPAMHDNTIYEDGNNISNGSGESFFSGKTSIETLRRGLISFDVSSIPSGATITSVTLTLHCTRSASLANPVSLHPALSSWGEGASVALGEGGSGTAATTGDATWQYRYYPDVAWATPGGEFGPLSATTQVTAEGAYDWSTATMVTDVQSWLDSPSTNYGWVVRGNEEDIQTAKRFASRENSDSSLRPVLVVEYVPVPAPGGCLAVVSGVLGCVHRRRAGGGW